MTVKQAAAKLEVSLSLIYGLCRLGLIQHTRYGRPGRRGTIRIDEQAIEAYRAACDQKREPSTHGGAA